MLGSLFVDQCPSCAGRAEAGLCATCRAQLAHVAAPCSVCGLARPSARCPRTSAWHVAAVVAPYDYAAPLDGYVHALKYRGARNLGRALGLLLVAAVRTRRVDALVPVPLHPWRFHERGYNQAVEIARPLGRALLLPLLLGGIERRGPYVPQTGQAAAQRLRNVSAAFAVRRDVRGARLAIVDDVITTGATVNALAAELLAAGAARCEAWAVARTPESRA